MKKFNRATATPLALLSVLISLVLVACGDPTATTAPATTAASTATTAPALATTVASVATTAAGNTSAAGPAIKVRITHVGVAGTSFGKAAIRFKELAAQKTNNRVQVEVFPDVSLAGGNNRTALEQLQTGAVEATIHSNLIYTSFDPKMEVFSLPYIMISRENAYKVIDSPAGKEILEGLDKINIVGLAYGENGFRQITNSKKPIVKPEDIKGLKIRVPETNLYVNTMKALGADPTVMTFSEVYNALQLKTIDGQENPLSIIDSSKLYEVQKYITKWDYSWDTAIIGFNKKFWETLPADVQGALRSAAQEAAMYMRDLVKQDDLTLADVLTKKGLEFTVLTADQKKPFIDATKSIYAASESKIGKDLLEKVRLIGQGS